MLSSITSSPITFLRPGMLVVTCSCMLLWGWVWAYLYLPYISSSSKMPGNRYPILPICLSGCPSHTVHGHNCI